MNSKLLKEKCSLNEGKMKSSLLHQAKPSDKKIQMAKDKLGISDFDVHDCMSLDPTKDKGDDYFFWIAKYWKELKDLDISFLQRITEDLTKFGELKRNVDFKAKNPTDIFRYTPESLHTLITQFKDEEVLGGNLRTNLLSGKLEGAQLVLNSGSYKIFKVTKVSLLVELSSGFALGERGWCTRDESMAAKYLKSDPSYVFYYQNHPAFQACGEEFTDRNNTPIWEVFHGEDYELLLQFVELLPKNITDDIIKNCPASVIVLGTDEDKLQMISNSLSKPNSCVVPLCKAIAYDWKSKPELEQRLVEMIKQNKGSLKGKWIDGAGLVLEYFSAGYQRFIKRYGETNGWTMTQVLSDDDTLYIEPTSLREIMQSINNDTVTKIGNMIVEQYPTEVADWEEEFKNRHGKGNPNFRFNPSYKSDVASLIGYEDLPIATILRDISTRVVKDFYTREYANTLKQALHRYRVEGIAYLHPDPMELSDKDFIYHLNYNVELVIPEYKVTVWNIGKLWELRYPEFDVSDSLAGLRLEAESIDLTAEVVKALKL